MQFGSECRDALRRRPAEGMTRPPGPRRCTAHGRRSLILVLLLALGGLAACGVPDRDRAQPIPSGQVPTGLLTPPPVRETPTESTQARPQVYLVDEEGRLVPRAIEADPGFTQSPAGGPVTGPLGDVLVALLQGPTAADASAGLSSALRPDARLTVTAVAGDLVEVDWYAGEAPPVGDRLVRSSGQIVLSLVSVPGVSRVAFTHDGVPVGIPSASGELVERPLTAADYQRLRVDG